MNKESDTVNKPKVISFINMKGGVGKTTLTINIGYTLVHEFHKNVLIIDMDPQFNATQALMTKFKSIKEYQEIRDNKRTIATILTSPGESMVYIDKKPTKATPETVVHQMWNDDNNSFDLLPGDLSLTEYESTTRGSEKLLAKFINDNDFFNKYQYILIDTPATYSVYSQASLLTSDFYIVPIAPDIFSSLGYELLQTALKKDLVLEDHNLVNLGIIFTMYNKDRQKRTNITNSFDDNEVFEQKLEENENIRSGNINNFAYDMQGTRENIIKITEEFLEKSEE